MRNLEIFVNPASDHKAIYIIARSGHKVVDIDKIIMCKADRNYTKIFLEDEMEIVVPKSLCFLENELNKYNFLRCSSSYLINLNKSGSFNRFLRKIYLSDYAISIARKRCNRIFPVLTAFGYKEVLRHTG